MSPFLLTLNDVVMQGEPLGEGAATGLVGQLSSYMVVSGILFVLGVATIITRRNALYVQSRREPYWLPTE